MSWLFGEIVKNKSLSSNIDVKFKSEKYLSFSSEKISIYGGGNLRNVFYLRNGNAHYFVSGIGITTKNGISTVMAKEDWHILLYQSIEKVLNTNGHFVIIKIENDSINIFTDKLGLRDVYITESDSGVMFGTKLEWFTHFSNLELNYNNFGSRWLLHNQISQQSVFKDLVRLVAGKSATIDSKKNCKVTYHKYEIEYNQHSITANEYSAKLLSFVNLNMRNNEKLSLSLSGGMDSRVLFALLVNNRKDFFETHSFGNPEHPDCAVAKKIITDFNIQHHQYNGVLKNIDGIIDDLKVYTIDSVVNNTASAILQLNNYRYLTKRNLVVVDGAPGEIWRHEYYFKILLNGKHVLLNKNIKGLISFLSMQRADIFNNDVTVKMESGLYNQFEEAFEYLPEIDKGNVREWLDRFALYTRIPNYIGTEQSRLDGIITGVMPFAQLSLISNLFSLDSTEKKNAKLFRAIIRQNASKLTNYPLVKGVSQHPFFLNTFLSRVWPKISSKVGKGYSEVSNTDILLGQLKEYIYDTINSKIIIEASELDHTKIVKIVDSYFINKQSGYELDWLLSFLIFKQATFKS